MVNYPYKKSSDIIEQENNTPINYANRGMNFEHAVNLSNTFYKEKGLALITKRPTPIHINKVDYSKARIVDAYFEKQSTTDYNGVYKGRYIDFECKETKSKSSLPMHNISKESILAYVWGYDSNAVENHVEVYVGFLRKKLNSINSNINIVALRNLGYHLEVAND